MASRRARTPILIVGEGACEKAFLDHLRSLYADNPAVVVKTRDAKGGGANSVFDYTVGFIKVNAFKIVGVLYDADVPLTDTRKKRALGKRIRLIESEPCLEGLLLEILGQPVPLDSGECKAAIVPYLVGSDTTVPGAYRNFDRQLLDGRMKAVKQLERLVRLIRGKGDPK